MEKIGCYLVFNTVYIQGNKFSRIALPLVDLLKDTNLFLVEGGSVISQYFDASSGLCYRGTEFAWPNNNKN